MNTPQVVSLKKRTLRAVYKTKIKTWEVWYVAIRFGKETLHLRISDQAAKWLKSDTKRTKASKKGWETRKKNLKSYTERVIDGPLLTLDYDVE